MNQATLGYRPLTIDNHQHSRAAAELLTQGTAIAHGFGNFYAITARGSADGVRSVNLMKGRPAGQVGSVTAPPARFAGLFDWTALPDGVPRACLEEVFSALLGAGPFGFRGPAHPSVPDQLASTDQGVRTVQLISPGCDCPSNTFLELASRACADDLLYVTSANRSRHVTGAGDTPAHWRAGPLREEFGADADLEVLEHADEAAARRRYPRHLPMSTTILAFHHAPRAGRRPSRPALRADGCGPGSWRRRRGCSTGRWFSRCRPSRRRSRW